MALTAGDGPYTALVGVMQDLDVDEAQIEAVIKALGDGSRDLDDGSFESGAHIRSGSFGGSDSADTLGFHHTKAHQIITDTIKGVTQDLVHFRDSTREALVLVKNADEQAADDLNRKREVADNMQSVWQNSQGDRHNQESRNTNLPGGETAAATGNGGGND